MFFILSKFQISKNLFAKKILHLFVQFHIIIILIYLQCKDTIQFLKNLNLLTFLIIIMTLSLFVIFKIKKDFIKFFLDDLMKIIFFFYTCGELISSVLFFNTSR